MKYQKVNCSNDRQMVMEGLRVPPLHKNSVQRKVSKEDKKSFRKLSKYYLLENKVVLKHPLT